MDKTSSAFVHRGPFHSMTVHRSYLVLIFLSEVLKFDEKMDIQYWEIPNTGGDSIAVTSGAGFWRFIFVKMWASIQTNASSYIICFS